ncbi:MAG: peptide chain release factor 1 [Nitriliruptoraceae bacterium]
MFERLTEVEERFRDIERQLSDPATMEDSSRYTTLARQHAELAPIVADYRDWRQATDDLEVARQMAREALGDDRALAESEITDYEAQIAVLEARLRDHLVPTDPLDDRDVIIEIRAAAGGDEAGLFAGELCDMYGRFAQARGWQVTSLSQSLQGIGGVKEAILEVKGTGAFAHLKHESGVHRVQRVPATESQGRIHTSTASVAVLPVADDVEVDIAPGDLRIDVYRSSGPGGQSVNTTDSAVRITHLPTGVVVACQDEKSQHQNRDKAMRILRSRLLQAEQERQASARADARRGQIGTGDRSEKIRTYNVPQSRVTDHRIGFTTHALADVLSGSLDDIIAALRRAEREQKLAEIGDEADRSEATT